MKKAALIGLMALVLTTPVQARKCINGTVMAANGNCMSPAEAAAMQRPQPQSQADARSCPMDFGWNASAGRCVPRSICPYGSKSCRR